MLSGSSSFPLWHVDADLGRGDHSIIERIKGGQEYVNDVIGMLSVLRSANPTSDEPTTCDSPSVDYCGAGCEELLHMALREMERARAHLDDEDAKRYVATFAG